MALLIRSPKLSHPDNTTEILAKYRMGYVDDHEIIVWAEQLLMGDYYSDSIACLAGYPPKLAKVEREDFIFNFEQAVSDLGLELPPPEDAYEDYGEYLCKGIIDVVLVDFSNCR